MRCHTLRNTSIKLFVESYNPMPDTSTYISGKKVIGVTSFEITDEVQNRKVRAIAVLYTSQVLFIIAFF